MSKVTIDGTEYVPANHATAAIVITTHNRPDTLKNTLESVLKHAPAGAYVAVIDDGSPAPAVAPEGVHVHRHPESLGIVAAKNRSLELAMSSGAEHIFLLDDDLLILDNGVWAAYADSPEGHLSYQFEDFAGESKLRDIKKVWDDGEHVAYTGQRGLFLYYAREVINTIGGFDPVYGRGYYEHVDLALRAHEAGFTTFKYMDLHGSNKYVYSLDEHKEVKRATPSDAHAEQVEANAGTFNARRDSRTATGFVPYVKQRDVVLTALLTGDKDPQRGTHLESSWGQLKTLHESITDGEFIVFHDNPINGLPTDVKARHVTTFGNVYFARWKHAYTYLKARPDIRNVVICDGTDVEFLQNPFEHIPDGKILIGDEHEIVANDWIKKNHSWSKLNDFWAAHGDKQLLNMGFMAGHRNNILPVLRDILTEWEDFEFDLFNRRREAGVMVGDMAIGNMVLYTRHNTKLVHGPRINTGFKRDERNTFSLIKHK